MANGVEIRVAEIGDVPGIAEVQVRTSQAAYRGHVPDAVLDALSVDTRIEVWNTILSESSWPAPAILVADDNARIAGFVHLCPSRDHDAGPEIGEVAAIYLMPEHWGKGWGQALLDRAVATLQLAGFCAATLWVLDFNARARRFYEAGGWQADGATRVESRASYSRCELRYRRALRQPFG